MYRLDEKDNFWEMGDTGPCGPCSEIHFDLRPDPNEAVTGEVLDTDRFVELWNLVFIQFNRTADGTFAPLPAKHVDTGMGFERLVAVLQEKDSNYDTDLFTPIIQHIETLTGQKYMRDEQGTPHRVVADHIRCLSFAVADGVMPSNEGRGYVIRSILRRAVRYGKLLGMDTPFMHQLVDTVAAEMGNAYPELRTRQELIQKIIFSEEERFHRTLDQGLNMLDTTIAELREGNATVIPGERAFELHDTFGFPLGLTQVIARENDLTVDEEAFEQAMEEQRERGRASWKSAGNASDEVYASIRQELGGTQFLGYTTYSAHSSVLALVQNGERVSVADEGDSVSIVLERTPFYGEAGGQVGDTGTLSANGVVVEIQSSKKPVPELIVHEGKVVKGSLSVEDTVWAEVDRPRRQDIAISHTATHILHSALRAVLGDHVVQAGSLVEPGRLRFDFSHYQAATSKELAEIEQLVNQRVRENAAIQTEVMDLQAAQDKGALAFFGEKYGEEVRVVQTGDFSIELCGGTHLGATGEIGLIKITSESSIAAGVRRIEALTGEAAYEQIAQDEATLRGLAELLKAPAADVLNRVEKLMQDGRELEVQLRELQSKLAVNQAADLVQTAVDVDGFPVLATLVGNMDRASLRNLLYDLKQRLGTGVVFLASIQEDEASFVAGVTPDLVKERKLRAGDIMKAVAAFADGRGGGRPEMAQGGSKSPDKVQAALDSVPVIVREQMQE